MKSRNHLFLIAVAFSCLVNLSHAGDTSKAPTDLMGTWDYTAMTALKNGKPLGTVHFQAGQWTITFNQDATWAMKLPSPPAKPGGLSGTYAIHEHEVNMKLANGSPYENFRFAFKQDGTVLTLTTKKSIISASREQ